MNQSITPKVIRAGKILKAAVGPLEIPFGYKFASPPVVLLTSYWQGGAGEVGHIETVTAVDNDFCVITSGNAAANYFVDWMAVGE